MEVWKPPEVWFTEMGNRKEYRAHADFSIPAGTLLKLHAEESALAAYALLKERVPEGKLWKIHYEICMEEFEEEE